MLREEILKRLEEVYGATKAGLNFNNAFELLIATILSAQCTDVRVNLVTREFFKEYFTPEQIAKMDINLLEDKIKTCGLFKTKANNIKLTCKKLVEEYSSNVPKTLEELITLPGVGRKTANVVLSNAFDIPAFAVDTHVFRVCRRLGLTQAKDPYGVEKDMCAMIPKQEWGNAHHWFIWHGRKICKAQKPLCSECFLNDICPNEEKKI